MPHSIEVEEDGILGVRLEGNVSLEEAREIRGNTAKNCREKRLERVLVDVRRATSIAGGSTLELYKLGSNGLMEINLPADTRVALIVSAAAGSAEDWKFLVIVEKNRGLKANVFTEEEEARDWLKE